MATGTAMPPIAATTGIASRRRSRSSPTSNSRLASNPTTRKKNVISPSLTHWRRSIDTDPPPSCTESWVLQTESYEPESGRLAQASAPIVAASSTAALPVSVLRKSRTGAATLRAHAVRPVRAVACAVAIARHIVASFGKDCAPAGYRGQTCVLTDKEVCCAQAHLARHNLRRLRPAAAKLGDSRTRQSQWDRAAEPGLRSSRRRRRQRAGQSGGLARFTVQRGRARR